jgi:CheY-like chemotaxis protein
MAPDTTRQAPHRRLLARASRLWAAAEGPCPAAGEPSGLTAVLRATSGAYLVTPADTPGTPREADRRPAVLVVQDATLVRTAFCDDLRRAEFRVIEACTADEALAVIRSGVAVEAVVADVRMPGSLDGFTLAAAARAALPNVAMIVMSSAVAEKQRMSLGPFEFIGKPFDMQRLITRLRVLSGTPQPAAVRGEDRYIPLDADRPSAPSTDAPPERMTPDRAPSRLPPRAG